MFDSVKQRVVQRVVDPAMDWALETYIQHPLITFVACAVLGIAGGIAVFWVVLVLPASRANLVENGFFDGEDLQGWGTGWVEDLPGNREQARKQKFLLYGGADARWYRDETQHRRGRNGRYSLRIEHNSDYFPQRYSTLAQRIRVRRNTDYEIRIWIKSEASAPGALWMSPSGSDLHWDANKVAIRGGGFDWEEVRLPFYSGDRVDIDVRFVAEAPVRVWIDDVRARPLPSY